jgi:hypothetical protein
MKKKTLLLTLLALAIVTSITAGTLAVYTKSVTMDASVEIKKFAFAAAGKIEGDAQSINLAPKESQKFNFTITNYEGDGGVPAEVPLDYAVSVDFSDAAAKMPGLTATLSKDGKVVAEASNGAISYADTTPDNTATKHEYVLNVTWAGDDNAAQSSAGIKQEATKGLKVVVNATQHI